jgi:hypothetical protein
LSLKQVFGERPSKARSLDFRGWTNPMLGWAFTQWCIPSKPVNYP